MYNRHRFALGLIHLRLLEASMFVIRYYSLGGDTAMPGRLYAVFCHTFLVVLTVTTWNYWPDRCVVSSWCSHWNHHGWRCLGIWPWSLTFRQAVEGRWRWWWWNVLEWWIWVHKDVYHRVMTSVQSRTHRWHQLTRIDLPSDALPVYHNTHMLRVSERHCMVTAGKFCKLHVHTTCLSDSNFIIRMLYKEIY